MDQLASIHCAWLGGTRNGTMNVHVENIGKFVLRTHSKSGSLSTNLFAAKWYRELSQKQVCSNEQNVGFSAHIHIGTLMNTIFFLKAC